MKNIICSIVLIAICFASCREDDTNSDLDDRIEGEWLISNLFYESLEQLNDPGFATWRTLELMINQSEDGSIELTSSNSPDFSIFPPSTTWALEGFTENVKYYRGIIEGEGIEGTPFRDYDVVVNGDNLSIITIIPPEPPEDGEVSLPVVCCSIRFDFIRKTEDAE